MMFNLQQFGPMRGHPVARASTHYRLDFVFCVDREDTAPIPLAKFYLADAFADRGEWLATLSAKQLRELAKAATAAADALEARAKE